MQRAIRQLTILATPSGGQAALVVKVAVASGPAHRFLVGDPRIQVLDVLAGRTLDALAGAAHLAASGEIVLEERTALHVEAAVELAGWRNDPATGRRVAVVGGLARPAPKAPWPALPAQGMTEAQLRPWLLPEIYRRLHDGHDQFLAELRPVVALMLQFGGIDYDVDATAGARLDAFVRWVQRVAARYEGHLLDITIGDKGSYLYVAFGAPVAHNDDAARAVAAGLELRAPSPTLAGVADVRIGIASGQMRCGAYGCADRQTYGVLGDRTNLAARLMEAAQPGQIICDDATYQQARGRWEFATLAPVQVKGKAGRFQVYEPSGAPAPAGQMVPNAIVGRQTELAYLRDCLDAVAAGQSRILVLEGEPGIGKSRLIAELERLCQERGLPGLIGRAQHIEQAPYRHWRAIFSACLGLDGLADPLERQARVDMRLAALAPDLQALAPLLNDVLNLGLPENAETRALDIAQRGERLSALLVALLGAWAATQPLVVALEDAQHLDTRSAALATRVAQTLPCAGRPLFLVVVLRPLAMEHPAMAQLIGLLGLPGARLIRVPPLSWGEIAILAAARLGVAVADLPSPIAKLVRDRADGNPLFVEELIATLRDQGMVRVEAAAGMAASGPRAVVEGDLDQAGRVLPDTLQGLILARLDRLAPAEQLTLKVASVIGSTFEFLPLYYTRSRQAAIDELALKNQLRALAAQDFTWLEAPEPHLAYRFKHVLMQEVTYQSLLYAQRRELHRLVAGWYETTYGGPGYSVLSFGFSDLSTHSTKRTYRDTGLAPYVGLLAYHYRQADDAARERRYAAMLGEQLFNAGAFREAIACFERSLSLTPDDQAHQAWRGRLAAWLARGYQQLGEPGQAQQLHQQSLTFAEAAADYTGAASACYELGSLAYRRAAHAEALSYLERSLDLYRAALDRTGEGRALNLLGGLYTELGEEAKALEAYQRAIALGRSVGQRREQRSA